MKERIDLALMYWRTLKCLKPGQVWNRLQRRVWKPKIDERPAPETRLPGARFDRSNFARPASLVGPHDFVFLNRQYPVVTAQDWHNVEHGLLWLYHAHYFDDLNAIDAEERAQWHERLLARWITENPPGEGVGWDPYPTSLRLVNWVKWILSCGQSSDDICQSMAIQARWLSKRLEYHLLGNHLLANGKALVFVGLFFEGSEAREWYVRGCRILEQQLSEQILEDGGHFERSPMYHLVILEDLIDLLELHRVYGVSAPQEWRPKAEAMLRWAVSMCHPDGFIPFFNDANLSGAPPIEVLTHRAAALGIPGRFSRHALPASVYHAESGFCRLETAAAVAFCDVGSVGPEYLPGHAHAGTLGVELSLGGRRILVNSGVSEYGTSAERLRQRGTAAHNTVTVDEADSSEVWSGFRVARRARVDGVSFDADRLAISARHNGYRRLHGRPIHERKTRLGHGFLCVEDEIRGEGDHDVACYWHLHPAVSIERSARQRDVFLLRHAETSQSLELQIKGAAESVIEETIWCPYFGVTLETQRLVLKWSGTLPCRLSTAVRWSTADNVER